MEGFRAELLTGALRLQELGEKERIYIVVAGLLALSQNNNFD